MPPINYELANRQRRAQKSALTRAKNSGVPTKVLVVCRAAVNQWRAWGAWPDDWSNWQRALDDVYPVFQSPQLEDL